MNYSIREINVRSYSASLYSYLLDTPPELNGGKDRPLVIVCPGGGYRHLSNREAEPMALRMNAAGFHAAVLRYSVEPAQFPVSMQQLALAVDLVKKEAAEWKIDPERIFVMGFSAGGHLAASLGTLWNKGYLPELPGPPENYRPAGLLLAYAVLSSGEYSHSGSISTLLGGSPGKLPAGKEKLWEALSLEKQVDKDTPPAFIWHTGEDPSVPVENSLLFASALRKCGVPFELHVYPRGGHGLALASAETATSNLPDSPSGVAGWMDLAVNWIRGFRK
ncbi:MAG: alpha/beta hydrolase [Treponema sp.]|jgi:acetyl esterase/lipase|nr:alpha/beta hydrolase [Treponema sp.]